ncbi:MAG: MoaD/ThiS family protein [Candidatus Aminicenantia bacterium]
MKIKLKIIGYLIYHAGFSEKELELSQSITVEELLSKINLNRQSPMLIIRNGKGIRLTDKIEDGDRIVITPFFSGG